MPGGLNLCPYQLVDACTTNLQSKPDPEPKQTALSSLLVVVVYSNFSVTTTNY
jgi:hypothetical protein